MLIKDLTLLLLNKMIEILNPIQDGNHITYPVKINNNLYNFEIKYNNFEGHISTNIDGIVVMLTPIAICNKWVIHSKLPIDIKLYNNLLHVPDTYKKYHHKHTYLLSHISKDELELKLDLPTCNRSDLTETNNVHITPISMGVDSLHTIMTNSDKLTHLIYIVHLDFSDKIKNFQNNMNEIATKYNKKLIIAESNFKQVCGSLKIPGTNYGVFLGDPILVASCYPLNINTLYLSGFGGNIPCIMGQHSEVNMYFNSNEFSSIQNETLRIKKIKYIIDNEPTFLNKLRVCNDVVINNNNIYNCSKCGKCTRTLAYLYMLGHYDKAITFKRIEGNYVEYYMNNFYNQPDKTLATTFYDKIFSNLVQIYNENGTMECINDYELKFIGDDNVIIKKP